MDLHSRLAVLAHLQQYLLSGDAHWQEVKQQASDANGWFIPDFIDTAVKNISHNYLDQKKLKELIQHYQIDEHNPAPKKVGLVMAGNIPLVGFHDLLCIFLTGHIAYIKPSSKDQVLIKHVIEKMQEWNPAVKNLIFVEDKLKGCDAYIATGSNNTGRYFEYYFSKYPHIIRRNRTSVAILTGNESGEELNKLADDIQLYFGLGCRNVTKIFVPEGYDFEPLLKALEQYNYFMDHFKYKNNYDYMLSIHLLNQQQMLSNGSIILIEEEQLFSPISQLNYSYYKDEQQLVTKLTGQQDLQCIVGRQHIPFGQAQCPAVSDFADGVDTLEFLQRL